MAESSELMEREGVQLFCRKEEEKENDSSVFGRLGSSSTMTPRKRRKIEETKGKSFDEEFVFSTLSRLRQGLTSGRKSLKRTSYVGSSPSIRRSGVVHPGSKSIFRSSRGSLTLRWRNSFKRNFRQSVQDYSLTVLSTPRQSQLLAACSYSLNDDKENEKLSSLRQNIRHEMKMADGAAKLLAASLNPEIALEAGQNFLISNARLDAYLDAFHRQSTSTGSISEEGLLKPCPATVTISDLRIPLVWRDAEDYLSKDDHCAAFCLLRIGSTICSTRLLANVDRNTTELVFDDIIAFEADTSRFECSLEVYVHRFCTKWKRAHASQTPLRAKRRDVEPTVRKQLSGFSESEEGNNLMDIVIGPKFECIAKATLTLEDVNGAISCYDLITDTDSTNRSYVSCGLALFGNFCCRLSLEPRCLTEVSKSGWLTIQIDGSDWRPFWCCLEGNELLGWTGAFESKSVPAEFRILLTQDLEVRLASDDDGNDEVEEEEKFRQLVITVNPAADGVCRYQLEAESQRDILDWKHSVLQRICDCSEWKNSRRSFVERAVDAPKSKTVGPNFLGRKSCSQMLLKPAVDSSPMTRFLTRLNIDIKSPDLETGQKVSASSAMRESFI